MRELGAAIVAVFVVGISSTVQAAAIVRGPFLQMGSDRSISVAFRTDTALRSTVRYGTSPDALDGTVSEDGEKTDHLVTLTGLSPATRYWYRLEVVGRPLAGGRELSFKTHPPPGSPEPFRFVAFGDSGNESANQMAVASRMRTLGIEPDFGLILGDIVYPNGEPWNFDPRYFRPYAALLRRLVIWPTIGNHDASWLDGKAYLDAFQLPTNNPEKSELYYSFDYGNAHFVCLDTHVSSFAPGSPQLQWAARDLAASTAQWKVAYFHNPPYSGGTHAGSDQVRDNIIPVLEAAGVDLVFSGHSHVYERTFLLKASQIVQGNRQTYDQRVSPGSLYVVSGAGGESGKLSQANHPLMAFQKGNTLGTSVIEVSGPIIRGYFLTADGQSNDLFTLYKNDDRTPPSLVSARAKDATHVEASFSEPIDAASAARSQFAISPAVEVLDATLQGDSRTVRLTTTPHEVGVAYALTARDIRDLAGNTAGKQRLAYDFSRALVARGGMWRVRPGLVTPDWTARDFDDSGWLLGTAPIGYGEASLATTVAQGGLLTLHARAYLDLPTGWRPERLALSVRYDDGFVAYLNGVEVARAGVPDGQNVETPASGLHEAMFDERFELPGSVGALLTPGRNVLAFEVHNADLSSSDLIIDAELAGTGGPLRPPHVESLFPPNGARGVSPAVRLMAKIRSDDADLPADRLRLTIDGRSVAAEVLGTERVRILSYTPAQRYPAGQRITAQIEATDSLGNTMEPVAFSFDVDDTANPAAPVPADLGAAAAKGCGCAFDPQAAAWPLAWLLLLMRSRNWRRRHAG